MKLPTKYKKDIHLIYVKPSGFDIRCEYRCDKSKKDVEYWIRIDKKITFSMHGMIKENFVDCLLFDYGYSSYSASIADVLAIDYVECYYDNNSIYDEENHIRQETVIARSGKLQLFSNKLYYPGFKPREVSGGFRYWKHNGNPMHRDDYVEILDYEVAK
jgi:hypothetical protein